MNDHNLGDLIIDDIEPKNSKSKSLLTIIALAIVVLIVAIVLTKIVLKDPNEKALLEEDSTELISSDLTLKSEPETVSQKTSTEEKVAKEVFVEKVQDKPKASVATAVKPKTMEATQEAKKDILKAKQEAEANAKKALQEKRNVEKKVQTDKIAKAKKEHESKMAAQIKTQQEAEAKRLAEIKALQHTNGTQTNGTATTSESQNVASESRYFIQVGSFKQTPSAHFLSVITNSGFEHTITPPSSEGIKKLLIGPYSTREEAAKSLTRVKDRINKSAFLIKK